MLAGLVLASFTVAPPSRARVAVAGAPAIEHEPASARVAPMSRGLAPALRMVDNLEVTVFESTTSASTDVAAVEAVSLGAPAAEASAEAAPEPEPETALGPAPKVEPEATPEPTPAPTPPISRPPPPTVAWVTNATTLWAEGRMLELMNATRARAGLVPLTMDIRVADTARAHSAAEAQVR
jgi:uncharacterized protein YkwD